jgi:hypothetical protein
MLHKETRKKTGNALYASINMEMAKPRMTRSARIAELKLETARILKHPSITMPGTVKKIIPSPRLSTPEKAHIAVDEADQSYRDLRFENTLTDEHGDDVRLKKSARVEVTVAEDPKT